MKERFEDYLRQCPLMAILRGITPGEIEGVWEVLHEAGFRLLEIPLNTPEALKSIRIATDVCKDRMMVGAGTVLTPREAEEVCESGGRFVVSPNTNPGVIRRTKELGMLSMPGFFTATEGFTALEAGADYLKLFPACLGPSYIKDLQAVLKAPIVAVGGVNVENVSSFLAVCHGVGIGSALYKPKRELAQISAIAH